MYLYWQGVDWYILSVVGVIEECFNDDIIRKNLKAAGLGVRVRGTSSLVKMLFKENALPLTTTKSNLEREGGKEGERKGREGEEGEGE